MEADALLPWVFAIKMGFYSSALFAAGIGLHAAISIIEPENRQSVLRTAAIAALISAGFFAAKLLILNAQLGGSLGATFDTTTMGWTWRAQSASALAAFAGAAALVAAWISRTSAFALLGAVCISGS
ncbi:MAG: hypothetical protein Q8K85_04485, partial [Hyphomicrobium sp.]|nr:hypothetical protein [Hyphomicrobium sp.]